MGQLHFPPDALTEFCIDVLTRNGVSGADAAICAKSLVLADMRGFATHGVRRLPAYVKHLKSGYYRADACFEIVREFAAGAIVDGHHGLGQVTASRAMDLAMDRARKTGASCIAIRNGGHIGAHGNVALRAAENGQLSLLLTSGCPALPAPGGVDPAITSAPLAIACPSGREFPLVLDMSLGVVARGHVLSAIQEGIEIPDFWAIDRHGEPTTDPKSALEGAINPIGGYKGFGLALMLSILGGILSGAAIGHDIADPRKGDLPFDAGHFILVIDIPSFLPASDFKARVSRYLEAVKASRKRAGVNDIRVPGERSHRSWLEAQECGVKVTGKVHRELLVIGREVGADIDLLSEYVAARDG